MNTIITVCIALLLATPFNAGAQSYPSKLVKIVVPYPAGGAVDVSTRKVAQKLQEQLGQPFVVENKPGASGTIGASAVAHAAHAQKVGAQGLMVIPRVLSRGSVIAAQKAHFKAILSAAPDLPAVIYNSPYYGFATRADLFFALRAEHPNLVGFKEFGGAADMRYAAENITSRDDAAPIEEAIRRV